MSCNEIAFQGKEQETMTDMGPPERVLQIPELLELICMHLPALDVLVNQRISKTWQSTIQGSRSLQEKLFFKASAPRGKKDIAQRHEAPGFGWNPFLSRFGELGYMSVYLNVKTLRLKDYECASWKKMFIVNPTTHPIFMASGNPSEKRIHLQHTDGVRMSQITDLGPKPAVIPTDYIELGPMWSRAMQMNGRRTHR